jgi:hypothetical protein
MICILIFSRFGYNAGLNVYQAEEKEDQRSNNCTDEKEKSLTQNESIVGANTWASSV